MKLRFIIQDIKFDRELNVDLMDMGMTIAPGMDPKVISYFLSSLFDVTNWNLTGSPEKFPGSKNKQFI